jgi:hypothetical protein
MKPIAALLILLLAAFDLTACIVPGADGRYATHDHGMLNRGP